MNNKRNLNSWHGVLATVLALLFMLFGGWFMHALFGRLGGMLAGTVLALIGLVFLLITRTRITEAIPMQLPPVRQFFASIGIMIGITCLNGAISVALAQVIPDYAARETAIDSMVTSMSPFAAILLVAVQPAICEEFFCRGFLVRAFRDLKSEGAVIFLTSLIFGCLHMDLYAFLPTALMGAAFAFIALRTKSLLIPIILHFGNNALSVVISYLSVKSDEMASSTPGNTSIGILIFQILFYLGIALFFLWFSVRWFLEKKILTKSGLIVFILAAVMVVAGYVGTLAMSMEFVANEANVVAYTDKIDHAVPLTLEEGNYSIAVTAVADDSVRIVFFQGKELLEETDYRSEASLSFNGNLASGEYSVSFMSKEGEEIDGGNLTYSIMVVRINTQ